MSKNALPVTVMIRGSVIVNFLPDRTRKWNFACVQLKTILRSSHHLLCGFAGSYNDPWLVAGGVLKRNVKVAADRRCPNSYNSNARFRAKARVQGTTLANTLVRNHQQGPDHFDDGFLRERSPRKQQENSTHLRRFHWVLEAP